MNKLFGEYLIEKWMCCKRSMHTIKGTAQYLLYLFCSGVRVVIFKDEFQVWHIFTVAGCCPLAACEERAL